jgi:hypothetical protein
LPLTEKSIFLDKKQHGCRRRLRAAAVVRAGYKDGLEPIFSGVGRF